MAITKQNVSAKDVSIFLMSLTAFNHDKQQDVLLSGSNLKDAHDIGDIFIILLEEYASFMNYEIFQTMQERYVIDEGQEALKYPVHLKEYVEKHKITEFVEIKGGLRVIHEKSSGTSQKMTLKIDIKETCKLARLTDLKFEIAKILDITLLGLQLLDVEKGCVVVTLLVVNSIVNAIFTGEKKEILTQEQMEMFQNLSVQWLKCKEYEWNFMKPQSNTSGKNYTGLHQIMLVV